MVSPMNPMNLTTDTSSDNTPGGGILVAAAIAVAAYSFYRAGVGSGARLLRHDLFALGHSRELVACVSHGYFLPMGDAFPREPRLQQLRSQTNTRAVVCSW